MKTEVGLTGVNITSVKDMETLIGDIPVDKVTLFTPASKAPFPVRTLSMQTSRALPMRMISITGAMNAISTKITPLPDATSPRMSSATKIWTRTVVGAPLPTTAPFGFLIRRLLAGPPIATATGPI